MTLDRSKIPPEADCLCPLVEQVGPHNWGEHVERQYDALLDAEMRQAVDLEKMVAGMERK